MYIAFLALLLAFMFYIPISDALKNKSQDKAKAKKKQAPNYYKIIAWMWGPAVIVLVMSYIGGISLADIGLRAISFNHNIWFTVITLVANGLALIFSLYTFISSLMSKKIKKKIKPNQRAATKYMIFCLEQKRKMDVRPYVF